MKSNTITKVLLIIIGVLILLLSFKQCQLNKANQQTLAYKDSVVYERTKTGEIFAKNDVIITSLKNLSIQNKELYTEVKKYQEKALVITKVVTKLVYRDTSLSTSAQSYFDGEGNKVFTLTWFKDTTFTKDNWFSLRGNTVLKIDSTLKPLLYYSSLDSFTLGTKLYVSLSQDEKNKKMLHINARTDFPGLTFTDLDGALLDPKKCDALKPYFTPKRWGIGVMSGYGLSIGNTIQPGWFVGAGLQYNFIRF